MTDNVIDFDKHKTQNQTNKKQPPEFRISISDRIWGFLKKELELQGNKNLNKEDWDTYWGWNSQRQRNIKSGEKGVRLEVKAPMRRFYRDAPLFKKHPKTGKHLLDKNGNKIPLITVDVFKKSFFHISQTELKRTGSDCK